MQVGAPLGRRVVQAVIYRCDSQAGAGEYENQMLTLACTEAGIPLLAVQRTSRNDKKNWLLNGRLCTHHSPAAETEVLDSGDYKGVLDNLLEVAGDRPPLKLTSLI